MLDIKTLQIPIFFADDEAKNIVHHNQHVQEQIIALLGEEAFIDGIYNKPFVASKVFNDKYLLQQLNAIIHPAVFQATVDFFNQHKEAYVLYEAIMLESGLNVR
ncbi:MAG: dephospho-CoA kinase [Chitinophagales bacterium]